MNADGTNVRQVTDNTAIDSRPNWSPSGEQIAHSSNRDGDAEIYIVNIDGSEPVQLTQNDAFDWSPTWSPNGEQIAFSSDRDGNAEIYVMNVDGSDVTRLTNSEGFDGFPVWANNGQEIVFSSERNGDTEIFSMSVNGENPQNISQNPNTDDAFANVAADGSIVYRSRSVEGAVDVDDANELLQIGGFATILAYTAIIVGSMLLLLKHGKLPFGGDNITTDNQCCFNGYSR